MAGRQSRLHQADGITVFLRIGRYAVSWLFAYE